MFFMLTTSPVTSLTTLTSVFQTFMTWMTTFLGTISEEPLLLIGVTILVVGSIIGLAYRALRGGSKRR